MAELRDELAEDIVLWPAVLRTLGALACRGQKDVACAYVRAHFPAHPSGALEKVIEDLENEDIGDRIGQELADAYHEARGWRTCDCDDIPSDDRPCPPCRVRRDADATEALNASAIAGQVPFHAPGGTPRRGSSGRGIATAPGFLASLAWAALNRPTRVARGPRFRRQGVRAGTEGRRVRSELPAHQVTHPNKVEEEVAQGKQIRPEDVRNHARFWSKVDKGGEAECWPWTGGKDGDYGRYSERVEGETRNWRAHRVAFVLNGGTFADGNFCLHSCHNPCCCNPAHLRAGTPQDNSTDMVEAGRSISQVGELNHNSKLTDEQVNWAMQMRMQGYSYRTIAAPFGVSLDAIYVLAKDREIKPKPGTAWRGRLAAPIWHDPPPGNTLEVPQVDDGTLWPPCPSRKGRRRTRQTGLVLVRWDCGDVELVYTGRRGLYGILDAEGDPHGAMYFPLDDVDLYLVVDATTYDEDGEEGFGDEAETFTQYTLHSLHHEDLQTEIELALSRYPRYWNRLGAAEQNGYLDAVTPEAALSAEDDVGREERRLRQAMALGLERPAPVVELASVPVTGPPGYDA
jgi:hypothetical protein